MSADITAAPIQISDEQLLDLRRRLGETRWPARETVTDWSQGVPLSYVQTLCEYWRTSYDWRRCEAKLNSFAPSATVIDDLSIHFLHARSPHANALPLVMTHGWPGSIVEFHKVIGPLANPTAHGGSAADAFHVVCPSLPGYGFSGRPTTKGWGVPKIGNAWGQLMARLGYERYVAQGGDWGSGVTHSMALHEPGCIGMHTNMPMAFPDLSSMSDLTPMEMSSLAALKDYQDNDSGYSKQQSTRPQTLGYGLADSPSGQLAWIIEKFWKWMDCGQGDARHPENVLSKDELLDNVSIYWLTNSGASSGRLYWESFNDMDRSPISKPTGCSIFPGEIFRTSRRWAEKRYSNLIHFNVLERGGHFAAFEQPEVFVNEVRTCFRALR